MNAFKNRSLARRPAPARGPTLAEPTGDEIAAFLTSQASASLTYPEVGATRDVPGSALPLGYYHDRTTVRLGEGPATYERARAALAAWRMFPSWARVTPRPLEPGRNVALLVRAFSLWWLNATRIVYVLEESGPLRRFGFAYGTLPGHVECGEERFLVEHKSDGSVWYEIAAFSRPRHPLVRLGTPLARRLQRRFARDSRTAMVAAVAQPWRGARHA